MKLWATARLKLDATPEHDESLEQTSPPFQHAKQHCINTAWENGPRPSDKITTKNTLDDLTYDELKQETDLQTAHIQIARDEAIDAVKSAKSLLEDGEQQVSKPKVTSPTIVYDKRALSFLDRDDGLVASIATVNGRVRPEVVLPEDENTPQHWYFTSDEWEWTQAVLTKQDGTYYLNLTCKQELDDEELETGNGTVLGVDLNVNGPFAATSTGEFIGSADELNHERHEYENRRGAMQETGTRSAHLAIQSVGSRFSDWSEQWLHKRANELLDEAERVDADGIVFEELKHIRQRISNNAKFQQWAFAKFIELVTYKAHCRGIWVDSAPAHYTSQECSHCGYTTRRNLRGKQFDCVSCDQVVHRDLDAAKMVAIKYVRLYAGQTCQRGGAACQPALKSGTLAVDLPGIQAVPWDSTSTGKPHPPRVKSSD